MKKKSTILRELLNGPKMVYCVGVALPVHAQMAEEAGFQAVQISGSSATVETHGLPDAGLITMSEMVDNVRNIVASCDIPVLADCETGFGTPINVRRTVASVIRAGAAGLFIEDQVFPPRCAMVNGAAIAPIEEACARYRAAVDQRNEMDPDFIIMARTDCRGAANGTVEDVIERAAAYFECGVDIVAAAGLRSREEVIRIRDAFPGKMLCHSCHLIRPYPTYEEMEEMGMCMTKGLNVFKVGFSVMWDMYQEMMKRGIAPWAEYLEEKKKHPLGAYGTFDLTGMPQVIQWEKEYATGKANERYAKADGDYDPEGDHPIKGRRPAF